MNLPLDPSLNIAALSQIFQATTNSYKPLFFLALLEEIKTKKTNVLTLEIITKKMLILASYPCCYFNLNFGKQDQVLSHLTSIGITNLDLSLLSHKTITNIENTIHQNYSNSSAYELLKYVPFRLLSPFFTQELKGLADGQKNAKTKQLAEQYFNSTKPLYKIQERTIELHPDWHEYLMNNLSIVQAWVELNWLHYLQKKNPNTPAICNKLYPPLKRESLTTQRKFWDAFLTKNQTTCIFTGDVLTVDNYELDHYIPWSYVGHNQHWNLVPILNTANSSKNNNIPDKKYITFFTTVHKHAIDFLNSLPTKQQALFIEDFMLGLQCSEQEIALNDNSIQSKQTKAIESLTDMAAIQGFRDSWTYSVKTY
ncbi:HNH endonuclease domain-containing protein [Aliivibrio fischeri]|uniref:HNH endonuclease domain-containing protein n=1 Tax=Aliivibrio fischeri TaxID=668 RepID=UPI0007C478E1|nr:HNH endonuclease domain-containing protein [Aliivibrio fischeri]